MEILFSFYLLVLINCTSRKRDQLNDSYDCLGPQKKPKINSTIDSDDLKDILGENPEPQSIASNVHSDVYDSMNSQFLPKSIIFTDFQRSDAIQKAVDLYSDIMRCSLFCTCELFCSLMEEKVSQQTLHMIYRPVLTTRILKSYRDDLETIENLTSRLCYRDVFQNRSEKYTIDTENDCEMSDENDDLNFNSDDDASPFLFTETIFNERFAEIFLDTPKPLRRLLTLRMKLLNTFGLCDDVGIHFDNILDPTVTESDRETYDICIRSITNAFALCSAEIIYGFLQVLENKTSEIKQKLAEINSKKHTNESDTNTIANQSIIDALFDVNNLMAHGSTRLKWAEAIISELERVKPFLTNNGLYKETKSTTFTDYNETDLSIELVVLVEKLTKKLKHTDTDTIYSCYLNENEFNEESQIVFKECETKLAQILTQIVTYTLNYYENQNF